jgi:pimeloyl-ACP methyl ester carboxylesterase
MARVRLSGLPLEVRDEGSGLPALLLHGFPSNNRLGDGVIPILREAGMRCIAPDLAGYGLSDPPGAEPGMERQAGWTWRPFPSRRGFQWRSRRRSSGSRGPCPADRRSADQCC